VLASGRSDYSPVVRIMALPEGVDL
jgi:hypothetical protein